MHNVTWNSTLGLWYAQNDNFKWFIMGNKCRSLPPDAAENHRNDIAAVLQEHADYYSPTPLQPGRYSLKKSSWSKVFLFFFQLDKKEIQLVEENFRRVFNMSALEKLLPGWFASHSF